MASLIRHRSPSDKYTSGYHVPDSPHFQCSIVSSSNREIALIEEPWDIYVRSKKEYDIMSMSITALSRIFPRGDLWVESWTYDWMSEQGASLWQESWEHVWLNTCDTTIEWTESWEM